MERSASDSGILPIQPQRGQGQAHLGTLADLKLKNSGASYHPLCRLRQLMSLIGLLRDTEKQFHLSWLHMRPIRWHLKNQDPRITTKGDPDLRSYPPTLKMVAPRGNVLQGPPIRPLNHTLWTFTDVSRQRMESSLRISHSKTVPTHSAYTALQPDSPRESVEFKSTCLAPRVSVI